MMHDSPSSLELLGRWGLGTSVALYVAAQVILALYASHRFLTLWRWWRLPRPPRPRDLREWPRVTVQLPLYNERRVVERVIDAAAALDYPRDRLEIQVLDDSTDETYPRAVAAVAPHAARGIDIRVIHRDRRDGFKAGALAAGLVAARGEFVAVFDADFVPPRDFLRRALPHFASPEVGLVQGRWEHLNRDGSALTAAQAVMLDSHFVLEHEARMRRGLFFNFNGSAGVWRRTCIDSAGGWSHDTLTEDLDLSYRAQLRGWRFVYDGSIRVPAELPADMEALKAQQRRWTKGSIQTARKLLPRVLASRAPLPARIEAFVHLTNNLAYPLLLALGLLLLPVLLGTGLVSAVEAGALQAAVIATGLLPVTVFLVAGQCALGRRRRAALDVLAALALGVGLALNNARAVLEGLRGPAGEWDRTPKSGGGARPPRGARYASARGIAGRSELALGLYFGALALFGAGAGHGSAVPFLALLCAGFSYVGMGSLRASLAAVPGRGVRA
jgi:cellulose synthase/poly-beta-1,6-N-acetylglucosamine synthase-like glycosyltransferase